MGTRILARKSKVVATTKAVKQEAQVIKKHATAFDERVDEFLDLYTELKEADLAHKTKYSGKAKQLAQMKSEFAARMEKEKLSRIEGERAVLTAKSRSSSSIDTKGFFRFLKSIGKASNFWQYAKISVGDAKKDWGENTLIGAGILTVEDNKYSSIDVNEL